MTVPHAARTDVGRRREHNEDSYLVELPVLAVADGVGGSAKGEVASSRALETFAAHAPSIVASRSGDDAVRAMHEAVLAANVAVHEAHRRDESLRGMAAFIMMTDPERGRAFMARIDRLAQRAGDAPAGSERR